MPSYKLCYFSIRGLGEMCRLLFAEAGVEYEDTRYTSENWPQHKPNMLFGQVPVLFVDGEQIAHSRAAVRYLAREFKLDGGDSLTAAKVDMWIEVMCEGLVKLPFAEPEEKRAELAAAAIKDVIKPKFATLEKTIAKADGNYIFGKNVTAADIAISVIVDLIKRWDGNFLDNFPNVKAMKEAVEARPNIAKWIEKRPKTDI